ncbi:hypothetical protein [Pelomonas sp. Root1237]|uniref:hypothetical protein n=1 Tax=Pelomonas sp. Root1237 TaxID=1736434 RepID=UPI0006FDD8A3|nr:hypothetical protein [Pelomonas sp. Root1237]KQV89092.1 hypothetical protein ASC91_10665 [Pelomonas sp. Root1237]
MRRAPGLLPRLAFAGLAVVALVAGIAGGLVRAGVAVPVASAAVATHAFLMICAFMGTVIGIERAVALKHPAGFAGPLASGAAGLVMLSGAPGLAAWLAAGASLAFVGVNLAVVRRQRAAHTLLLLAGAVAWAAGSLLHALGLMAGAVVPLWFCFLVFTIAAERLEMTRLMRRHAGAGPALLAILAVAACGAVLSGLVADVGGLLYGLSLAALASWLAVFDIARRTVRAAGLSRYMALCLLTGYFWLAVAGLAWAGTALGLPWRDAALHGLALGFVFSMVFGHAPVILPAVARVKLAFGWPFYLPLALLHASLAVRLFGGLFDARMTAAGATGNALAIAAFVLTLAGAAIAWRAQRKPTHDALAENR